MKGYWYDCNYWEAADVGCAAQYTACELLTPGVLSGIAASAMTFDAATATALSLTPGGACFISLGILHIDWGGTGSQSVNYNVNSEHTGYSTSYGSCN